MFRRAIGKLSLKSKVPKFHIVNAGRCDVCSPSYFYSYFDHGNVVLDAQNLDVFLAFYIVVALHTPAFSFYQIFLV